MRKIIVIFLIFCMIGVTGVMADYSEIIEYQTSGWNSYTQGSPDNSGNMLPINTIYFSNIEQYPNIKEAWFTPSNSPDITFVKVGLGPVSTTVLPFTCYTDGVTASGTVYIIGTAPHEKVRWVFDEWDIGTKTGNLDVILRPGTLKGQPTQYYIELRNSGGGSNGYFKYGRSAAGTNPIFVHPSANTYTGMHEVKFEVDYKSNLTIVSDSHPNYVISNVTLNRNVGGTDYPSTLEVLEGSFVYLNKTYDTAGISTVNVQSYPIDVFVYFGYPLPIYTHKVTYYANENYTEENTTIAPTPTPTPVPELCGYWSLTVNTSNIIRNGYVQGTLAETDTGDNYDVIDWYQVLPSGQEFLMYHYVYDPGIFGLGAGWFLVDPYTGTPTASSEAAAKQNTIQYTTSGGAHYLRVKIFDDKSLVPLAYHDYDLACTLNQIVYVGETTQATSELGINLYESDTNAMIGGAEIHTKDKNSGEWQNKTSTYGGTVYFNVVPGNTYRILIDDSRWITYDQDYTVPSPPGILPIYLKRPLAEIENASYIHFYVRDASTYTAVMNAGITLSDGQVANTLSTGYAGFNVTDNALIYYTVSRSGYNSLTGSFQITEDTTKTVYLYPKVVTTIPTTVPYWTQTPTPLATYPNGTVIPGQTIQPTITATLNVVERGAALTEATDVWYRNAGMISNLMFVVLIIGLLGLMTKSMGGGRSGRRRS